MKKTLLSAFLALALSAPAVAQQFVGLTPLPKQMTVGTGKLTLTKGLKVSVTGLTEPMLQEVERFVATLNATTGLEASVTTEADGLVQVSAKSGLEEEAYELAVQASGITVAASQPAGLFYALQSIKKMLPANVMAGVSDAAVTTYELPFTTITDSPRYAQRSFMLDVSRHFFSVEEVKRMLDIMAVYKMNRFHWHLSDDQGWRVEIKKYPRLTTVGATAPNVRITDIDFGGYYWANKPYGPLFYTQEELRDVVAYAAERHIEIVPEIDMPGHFVAALVAYPEFSCSPSASRSVWTSGGISSDVMNVANPAAVQFAKDILEEIMDIFPGEYIHIGGDECPTSAWEGNAQCQALYAEQGFTSYRQLQSYFISQVGEFIREKGRKVAVWNEAITASGADTKVLQDLEALVYCWTGATSAANKAQTLGLPTIFTPQIPYYINRKQRADDLNAGDGSDNLERVYSESPFSASVGIQGTFWTEHVSNPEHLEYQALPRLIAIAEAGWTPQARRSFSDFCSRITADSTLLNYGGYRYNKDYMTSGDADAKVMPTVLTSTKKTWYRIVTRASGDRSGRCWELLREGSSLISQYAGKGALAGRVWTTAQVDTTDAAYDYQMWGFEEDPANAGHYAIVCKALPNGSLSGTASANNNTGRFTYDASAKHYDFLLGEGNYYGADGDSYYYSVRSTNNASLYLNSAASGQGYSLNLWNNPADSNAGLFTFVKMTNDADEEASLESLLATASAALVNVSTHEEGEPMPGTYGKAETAALQALVAQASDTSLTEEQAEALKAELQTALEAFTASFGYLQTGKTYVFENTVSGFEGECIADNGTSSYLTHSADPWAANAWEVTSESHADGIQTVALRNAKTARSVGAAAASATSGVGCPVGIGSASADVRLTFSAKYADYTIAESEKNFFPIPAESSAYAGIVSSGSTTGSLAPNAIRPQGAAWRIVPVTVVTFECIDDSTETSLGTFQRSVPTSVSAYDELCPELKNYALASVEISGTTVKATYKRASFSVTTTLLDAHGGIVSAEERTVPVGEGYTVSFDVPDYYTLASSDIDEGTSLTPTEDISITAVLETEAHAGVKAVCEAVTELEDGHSYIVYDNSDANSGARRGFRTATAGTLKMNRVVNAADATPLATFTFIKSGSTYRLKNEYTGLYIPSFSKSENPALSASAGSFYFHALGDGTFRIQGTNGVCWDGNENGMMVGWDAPAHPHIVYSYFVEPYFEVTVEYVDTNDSTLAATTTSLVKAGSAVTLSPASIDGYVVKSIEGLEELGAVGKNVTIRVVYVDPLADGISSVTTDTKPQGIFDIHGRRLTGISSPGVYIVDGQKVIVK